MKKVLFALIVSVLGMTACGGSSDAGQQNKPETIYKQVIIQQQTVPAQPAAQPAAPARPDIVLGSYVMLNGVLNVDKVRFELNQGYGSEYNGTFTNHKVKVSWSVAGTLTPRTMDLVTVGEKSTWTFRGTGDGQGNYNGRAQLQGGGGYNFKVHL